MWQAYVRFRSGSTTRADVAENADDARKALEDAMGQLKSNGIGTVGPSLVVTKDDLEFIKLEQKQPQDQQRERLSASLALAFTWETLVPPWAPSLRPLLVGDCVVGR
jgi:hypothetical protein